VLVPDPVWGPIEIDDWVLPLLASPEIQRLRQVRLLNSSPSGLPALSDVRRFTHTVGVTGLGCRIVRSLAPDVSRGERRALVAACVLHDVGTPPFGHSFEYLLRSQTGWTHESMLPRLLKGDYRPEGRYAQIFHGKQLSLRPLLKQLDVPEDLVVQYVQGEGRLGGLIAGALDLDNIDNVFRMALLLGLGANRDDALALADSMSIDDRGTLWGRDGLEAIESWGNLRHQVYSILAFDPSNLQYQAMLTEALRLAMDNAILSDEHWSWTDEALLDKLERETATRSVVRRLLAGPPYRLVFTGWYKQGGDVQVDLRRSDHSEKLRSALDDRLSVPTCPYVFYDRGTFRKGLRVNVRLESGGSETVSFGEKSVSTIACVYARTANPRSSARVEVEGAIEVLERFGLNPSNLAAIPSKHEIYGIPGQTQLPL
jgi:uncharacterized protein